MTTEDPKVFLATYSNTVVYESVINECPLMRRCKDDWVNATQILKCCNIPKAKRTKILEKGVQQGLHEKIQGGYGRFQGTWIPLADAQRLAHTYGLTPDVAPVLFFDAANPGFEISKKTKEVNKDGTPVKRKYVKKKKPDGITPKKVKLEEDPKYGSGQRPAQMQQHQQGPPPQQQPYEFNPNETYTAMPPKGPSHVPQYAGGSGLPMQFNQQAFNHQEYVIANAHANAHAIPTFQPGSQPVNDYNYQVQVQNSQPNHPPQASSQSYSYGFQQSSQTTIAHPQIMGQFHHSKATGSQSTNDTNWSQDDHKESDTSMSSNEEMKSKSQATNNSSSKESYSSQLLKFFSEENSTIPYFITNPPYDFNINEAIDDEGHTPLHWAASIGNYNVIHLLTMKGANPLVVNNYGLNPLSKLISFNNCFELKNFPKVLDDLEICLINTDINGRTPLHYLCQFSKVKSKLDSLMYYLEIILNKLTVLTNQSSNNKSINLTKNVLDHQDVNGDTCLHLAVKAGCARLVKFLLGYNVRDDLVNINQETAKFLIIQDDLLKDSDEPEPEPEPKIESYKPQPPHQQLHSSSQPLPRSMETPTQPHFSSLDTPDTQRTTVQDDDDDSHDNARVNKEQLNQLLKNTSYSNEDNKENIFLDTMKSFESMSTPIQATKMNSFISQNSQSQQPLAVISERTAESTPIGEYIDLKPHSKHENKRLVKSESENHSYQLIPPRLDVKGRLIDEEDQVSEPTVPPKDFDSIISSSVKTLTTGFQLEVKNLTSQISKIQTDLIDKEQINDKLIERLVFELSKIGIDSFSSLQEAQDYLDDIIASQGLYVKHKEFNLTDTLEQLQAYQLAKLVSANEENIDDFDDVNDNKWDLAVELTNLQIQRSKSLFKLKNKIKNYGIDDKMYKYRKLISLSCGLKIDEIDSLIDGIEESLMDTHK